MVGKSPVRASEEQRRALEDLIPPSVSPDLRLAVRAATAAPQSRACEGKRPDGRARRLRASVKPDVSGFTLDSMSGSRDRAEALTHPYLAHA